MTADISGCLIMIPMSASIMQPTQKLKIQIIMIEFTSQISADGLDSLVMETRKLTLQIFILQMAKRCLKLLVFMPQHQTLVMKFMW